MKTNDALRQDYFEQKKFAFEQGCAEGKATACFSLGEWHQLIGKDLPKAAEIYHQNCTQRNHANSCFNLALLYYSRKVPTQDSRAEASKPQAPPLDPALKGKSYKECAYHFFDQACKHGNSQACGQFAAMKIKGAGCEKDVSGALGLLEKACKENDAHSCVTLAATLLKEKVDGVERDPKRAFKAVQHGCDLGHPNACQILAVMYKKGDGVDADPDLHEKYKKRTQEIIKQTGEKMGIDVV